MGVAWANAKEQIGTALLPTLDRIAVFISSKVIPGILKLGPVFKKIGAFVEPAADAIKNLFSGGGGAGGAQLAKTFQALVTFAKPLLAILVDLGKKALAIIGPALSQIGNLITTQLLPAFRTLLPILQPVAAFLLRIFGGAILGIIQGFVNVIKGAFQIITGIIQVFAAVVTGDWDLLWKGLGNILKGAWNVIKGIFQVAINVGIVGVIKKLPSLVWGLFKLLMKGAVVLLKAGWNAISSLFKGALSKLGSAVKTGLGKVGTFFKELPGKILGFLKSLPGKLLNIGKQMINGLIEGIKKAGSKIGSVLVNLLPGPLRKFAGKLGLASPSKVFMEFGEQTVAGYVKGIQRSKTGVSSAVVSIADAAIGAGQVGIGPRFSSANLATAGGAGVPDMPIVDGSQIIGYLRDVATSRARIEIAANNRAGALQARYATP
jgi:phage-related protein